MSTGVAVCFQRAVERLLRIDPLNFHQAARSLFAVDAGTEWVEGDNISRMSDLYWIIIRDDSVPNDSRSARLEIADASIGVSQHVVLVSPVRCMLCNVCDTDGNLAILLTRRVVEDVEGLLMSQTKSASMIASCTGHPRAVLLHDERDPA